MEAIHNINLASLVDTLLSLISAFVLGGLVGFERQYRQVSHGRSTQNVLVAVRLSGVCHMACHRLHGDEGLSMWWGMWCLASSFLGAGVIMREEGAIAASIPLPRLGAHAGIGACGAAGPYLRSCLGYKLCVGGQYPLAPDRSCD